MTTTAPGAAGALSPWHSPSIGVAFRHRSCRGENRPDLDRPDRPDLALTCDVRTFFTGIKDLTPLFADGKAMAAVVDALVNVASGTDLVTGIDSRGFLVAAAIAGRLRTGALAIRKGGKLSPPLYAEQYHLEYGSATLEIPADGIDLRGRDIVIVDDVLATGGTLAAAARLLDRTGANVTAAAVVVELVRVGWSQDRRAIAAAQLESRLASICVQPVEASLAHGLLSASGMRMKALATNMNALVINKLLVYREYPH